MTVEKLITEYANKFVDTVTTIPNVDTIPTDDWGWENYRYTSDIFRLLHIELYNLDNLYILHITCFPHKNDTYPIYGFDVICSTKNNTIMGAFIDLSPTLYDRWEPNFQSKSDRELPEWATVFSKNFIALKSPTDDEWFKIFDTAYEVFLDYITNLGTLTVDDTDTINTIIDAQNRYCEQQQKNKRTFGALKVKIGADRAKLFMETILFPKIEL